MKELNDTSTYNEIKEWFLTNYNDMPKTLDTSDDYGIYYLDVKFTIDNYIRQVDHEIERLGSDVRKSVLAKTGKHRLLMLYIGLKKKENWNQPLKELCQFHNKM